MKLALVLIPLMLVPVVSSAQEDAKRRPTPSTVGTETVTPQLGRVRIIARVDVGEDAPDFELARADGSPVRLSGYRGRRLLLAFADRREAFSPFAALAESLRADSVELVGICRTSPHSLQALAERDGLTFDLLSDPIGEIAALYGTYDFVASTVRPAYVMVGRTGKVRMVLLGQALPSDVLL
jgi:peroxiredoxin